MIVEGKDPPSPGEEILVHTKAGKVFIKTVEKVIEGVRGESPETSRWICSEIRFRYDRSNHTETSHEVSGTGKVATARAILGVGAESDRDAVIKAYRSRAALIHPDKHGGGDSTASEMMKQLNTARDVLLGR